MASIITVFLIGIPLTILLLGGVFVAHKASFRYPAIIARQVGGSVIIVNDRFKISKGRKGQYLLSFWKSPGKMPAPEGKFLTKFARKGATELGEQEVKTVIDNGGLFFSATRGSYKPLIIKTMTDPETGEEENLNLAHLSVVNEDDKQFHIQEIEIEAQLSRGIKDKLIAAGIIVGAMITSVILVIVVFSIAGDNAVQVAAAQSPTIIETVQGVVGA